VRAATLFFLATVACSKPSIEEAQSEAYAAAYVAINSKRPDSMAKFVSAIGVPPSECRLGDGDGSEREAACLCTWRFLTKEGPKEITAGASYEDERNSQPDSVAMTTHDGGVFNMAPDEAERAFRSGQYGVMKTNGRIPVEGSDGVVGTAERQHLEDVLNGGGHLVSPRRLRGAELDARYTKWTAQQRIGACVGSAGKVVGAKLGETEIMF
jgi:hypothetical protein